MQNIFAKCLCGKRFYHHCQEGSDCCKKPLAHQLPSQFENQPQLQTAKAQKPDLVPLRSPRSRKQNRLSDLTIVVEEAPDLQEVSQATYQRSTRETRLSISPRRHQQAFEQGLHNGNSLKALNTESNPQTANGIFMQEKNFWDCGLDIHSYEENLNIDMHNYSVFVHPGSFGNELPVVMAPPDLTSNSHLNQVQQPLSSAQQMDNYSSFNRYNSFSNYSSLGEPMNIHQLQELAFRQQQEIAYQNDVITQQRNYLNELQFWREYKHRLSNEYGKVWHLRAKVESQETLLYDFRLIKSVNPAISSVSPKINLSVIKDEVQAVKEELKEKENQLFRSINQVEDLNYHLKSVKNFRLSKDLSSQCEVLKRQFSFWYHFNEHQKNAISAQQETLKNRKMEMESLNEKILELQELLVRHKVKQNLQYRSTKSPSADSLRPSPSKCIRDVASDGVCLDPPPTIINSDVESVKETKNESSSHQETNIETMDWSSMEQNLKGEAETNPATGNIKQSESSPLGSPKSPDKNLSFILNEKSVEVLSTIPEDEKVQEKVQDNQVLIEINESIIETKVEEDQNFLNENLIEDSKCIDDGAVRTPKGGRRNRDKSESGSASSSPKLVRETCKEIMSAIRESKTNNEKGCGTQSELSATEPKLFPETEIIIKDVSELNGNTTSGDANDIANTLIGALKLELENCSKENGLKEEKLEVNLPMKSIASKNPKSDIFESIDCLPPSPDPPPVVTLRKLLKNKAEKKEKSDRRVSFDPLALLLDASLEGELEIVRKCVGELGNASKSNDDGITALHNAICAEHFHVVKYLIDEAGADVNAVDSDGWTPLHCAASSDNKEIAKFLVERGSCIFASTRSDFEIPVEKCEYKDEFNPDDDDPMRKEKARECAEYLREVTDTMGTNHSDKVFGLYDFTRTSDDELDFSSGDQLRILRRGDDFESEWWWAEKIAGEKKFEGYVPRNLLGLYPRIQDSVFEIVVEAEINHSTT